MNETTQLNARKLTRVVEAKSSLACDIVRYCSPVLAGIRPGAMFSCLYTRKPYESPQAKSPNVLLFEEFKHVLRSCREELEPYGVRIEVLAWRKQTAMLYVYRPDSAAYHLQNGPTALCLKTLGYDPTDLQSSVEELKQRIAEFDELNRSRHFWDFPHEIGHFLGYPAADVIAFTRNLGHGFSACGTWRSYGCPHRTKLAAQTFQAHEECTEAYWNLYLEGASLSQLANLGQLTCS